MEDATSRDGDGAAELLVNLEQQHRAGSQWFYWIAALTLINTAGSVFGSSWGFVVGLGITQVVESEERGIKLGVLPVGTKDGPAIAEADQSVGIGGGNRPPGE